MSTMDVSQLEKMVMQHVQKRDSSKRFLGTIYQDLDCMNAVIAYLAEPYRGKIDAVASPESVGFILGSMMARELGVAFVPIRKGGSADEPEAHEYIRASYIDHRNSVRSLRVRTDSLRKGDRILMVDNWVETAATLQTCLTLLDEAETKLAGIAAFGIDKNGITEQFVREGLVRTVVYIK